MPETQYISARNNGWPPDAAQAAYEKDYYTEAIQILHGWLECQARQLISLVASINFKGNDKEIWELTDTISLNDSLKILRILNQITKEEFNKFKNFNSLRNKVIHDLYKEPYEKVYLGIPKEKYDIVFNDAKEQYYFFTEKCELLIG